MSALALQLTRSARAAEGLERIAAALAPTGTVKAKVRAAHARIGLPYSRTREIWYGRARRIDDAELAAIEAAVPPESPEFSLAYLRSVETRVASALDELRAVLSHMEAAAGGDPPGQGGRGDAPDRP